ncbi:DUF4403 family protein [Pedobacter sp. SYSU D00535]|uniref:DUF4403 family protein n=1 Tax=Pedobacter sp. SYSU D00535 TaxID=2810308 RepID=UPI001A9746F7|nr:DUF4403 family protein [Pedobacter sp. SYSU D00535]
MYFKRILFVITLIAFSACSTSQKIESLKPAASYSKALVYDKQISHLALPVEISIADIQLQVNKYLNGLVYEDNNLLDDDRELKVWKQGPILISEMDGKLQLELPLKVWAKIRYGVEKLGVSAHDTREVNLNGVLKLSAAVGFSNWRLSTVTEVQDVVWTESPTLTIMGKNLAITYLINPALALFKGKMGKMVDEAMASSGDVRPMVLAALESVCKPRQLNEEYNAWLAIQPSEVYASKAIVSGRKVTMNLGMKAYLETAIGSKPALTLDKGKLLMKAVDKMPADFNVTVASFVTYPNAAALIQKNLVGQKFESGKRSVTVTSVNLWGKDNKMIIELGLKGTVNGLIYLSGIPGYDAAKQEIFMQQVDFVLDSKNKLLKMGDWLVHDLISKKIETNCRFSISSYLKEGQKSISSFLTNYQPIEGVRINGTLTKLAPNKVVLTPNALVALVVAKGKAGISINGMKP